jgi:hypothetical protein
MSHHAERATVSVFYLLVHDVALMMNLKYGSYSLRSLSCDRFMSPSKSQYSRVRASASSFVFQNLLLSLRSALFFLALYYDLD